MKQTETDLMRTLEEIAPLYQMELFRNNVGFAWMGKSERRGKTVVIHNARPVRFGLCKGSSDLIGWKRRGDSAIFTAVETKIGKAKTTKEQDDFLDLVNRSGGIGIVARDPKDLADIE